MDKMKKRLYLILATMKLCSKFNIFQNAVQISKLKNLIHVNITFTFAIDMSQFQDGVLMNPKLKNE